MRKITWRRKWQSTPALLPGKSHGRRSLTGYSPWGRRVGHDYRPWDPRPWDHRVGSRRLGHNWATNTHRSVMLLVHYEKGKEKAVVPHSSTLAWKIPWTEQPVRLQSMGSLGVRHNWATSLSFSTFMHWRGKWQPTPVFLPGESQGRGSLVGCRLWGHTELNTTKAT